MKRYKNKIVKEDKKKLKENYRYYKGEFENVLPIDQYGARVKIESSSGESKWINLNRDSMKAFIDTFKSII